MKTNNTRGLTLIEILTAAAVGGAVLALVYAAMLESVKTWNRERDSFASWHSGMSLMRDLSRDSRRALPGGMPRDYGEFNEDTGEFQIVCSGNHFATDNAGRGARDDYVSFFYVSRENGKITAVNEIETNGERRRVRVYENVESFSVSKIPDYPGMIEITLKTAGRNGAGSIRSTVLVPAERIF